jgi:hypothetical protein
LIDLELLLLDGMRDGNLLFGLGMPPHVFGLSMLPISVFYLTLERITIIHLAGRYGDSERRRLLGCYGASLVVQHNYSIYFN